MNSDFLPEWLKVKVAAVLGVGTPMVAGLVERAGPALDALIKLGQVGVAIATILYILAKWRAIRKNRK